MQVSGLLKSTFNDAHLSEDLFSFAVCTTSQTRFSLAFPASNTQKEGMIGCRLPFKL